ncbi:MAG TPA: GntR family transcriptional regulator [Stellaceae bacterium]|nr:GntR family transcriptional regulator [Stellaceae bacterium]
MQHRSDEVSEDAALLDRDSPIPLYMQIKQYLARQIAVWGQRSDKFFTDAELCEMFGVSRMTARQAVQELVDEGMLKRARGIGTFVVARKVEEQLTPVIDDQWNAAGRPIDLDLLAYEMQPCPTGFADDLGIAAGAPVRYVFRLRKAGGVPIALDHRYIPLALATEHTQADARTRILRPFFERFEMSHAEIRLEATTAGQQEVRWLGLALGAPLMMRRMRYLTAEGLAVLAGCTIYRADLVRYSIHMPLSRDTLEPAALGNDKDRVVRLRREMVAPESLALEGAANPRS